MENPKATSVRQKLLTLARKEGEDYNQILVRYVGLRFLARLASSQYASQFLLKGATLFLVWGGSVHRPTRDIDLLGFLPPDEENLRKVMQEICLIQIEEDGLEFDPESVRVDQIREDTIYGGLRCLMMTKLGSARLQVQIDVGFGDAVTPRPDEVTVPSLLPDHKGWTMMAYTPETVIAEKLEAIARLGLANSRMKDYFDLDLLLQSPSVSMENLTQAVRRTFERRETPLEKEPPIGLTESFWNDEMANRRWQAFLSKNRLPTQSLQEVCGRIADQLREIITSAARDKT
jgi:predicted nucleotidyltransferase component of viral defense system